MIPTLEQKNMCGVPLSSLINCLKNNNRFGLTMMIHLRTTFSNTFIWQHVPL